MRALSLWQPHAQAIALGLKPWETRDWPTRYRGPLAIHGAKRLWHETGRGTMTRGARCIAARRSWDAALRWLMARWCVWTERNGTPVPQHGLRQQNRTERVLLLLGR
jgi:hypothetical protein